MNILSASDLRQLLDYDEATGLLFWKPRPASMFSDERGVRQRACDGWNTKFAGKEALNGAKASHGYKSGAIYNRQYLAHRVIFVMVHGYWPIGVDHINGDKRDNRISNLREADPQANAMNCGSCNAKRGLFIGVRKHAAGRWRAEIRHHGKSIHVGMYDSAISAARARDAAALKLRGDFARLNFPQEASL
ncbi:HNH endonuclease [Thioclava sp. NG1]|uniref:HNH endonuclease n=1 Tax=Thioclava sp. NG1 TaxID=2182426 RepID=UPI000D622043|nr:HNH endonuclease [Thioclava sp. NG1]PWE48448.1 HNH endonuclease [Thioclava sp. NG1]